MTPCLRMLNDPQPSTVPASAPMGRIALRALVLIGLLSLAPGMRADGREFVAYSLRVAESRVKTSAAPTAEWAQLGGITHLAGVVQDSDHQDLILVGERIPGDPAITLDDWVVALRAILNGPDAPLVSIDPAPETGITGRLKVRFEGGIARTQFGRDALACDVLLKRLALQEVPAELWGVQSYLALRARESEAGTENDGIASRFWFKSREPTVAVHPSAYAILDVPVAIETEVLQAQVAGRPITNLQDFRDRAGDQFARQVELNLDRLAVEFPLLKRARQLLALVSLAEGVRSFENPVDLSYWLKAHPIASVETPEDFELLEAVQPVAGSDLRLRITGGFDLTPYAARLKRGYPSAFREVVLKTRPGLDTLVWHPPLRGWQVPGVEDLELTSKPGSEAPGFALDAVLIRPGATAPSTRDRYSAYSAPPIAARPGPVRPHDFEHAPLPAPTVGGVWLPDTAQVKGASDGRVSLGQGHFALLVDGQQARLEPAAFRRFVTALWAVYFSNTDPGISIDPIAPGVSRHWVRYIGNVVNLDLGRVMREADYLMKQWAVGAQRPSLPGFLNPDDIAGRRGVAYVGVGSRFWFVPEGMTFRRAGDLLVFESGRITVKTEFLFNPGSGLRADPANEQFAHYFTTNYAAIAQEYPIYRDLEEYARLVSLAKYVKQSGAPLLWFLLANKDLALTEDSPGTVEALVQDSAHFEGVSIEGGVQLVPADQYVLDAEAIQAIQESPAARPALRPTSSPANHVASTASPPYPTAAATAQPAPNVTWTIRGRDFSTLPRTTLTVGQDRRGQCYQTDLALRAGDRPGLELVRYFSPGRTNFGEFGDGWRLLIPYRVLPEGDDRITFRNVRLPERMRLEHRLTGQSEILRFSTNRYTTAGWVPDRVETSEVAGLFLITDASFRLEDKLGNQFRFDQAGRLTDMLLGDERFEFEYLPDPARAVKSVSWRIEPGSVRIPFLNVRIPETVRLIDPETGFVEELRFTTNAPVAGYMPTRRDGGRCRFLALLSDASFRLLDVAGNEIEFDAAGDAQAVSLADASNRVSSIRQSGRTIRFEYGLTPGRAPRITQAVLEAGDGGQARRIRYAYDATGRLCSVK